MSREICDGMLCPEMTLGILFGLAFGMAEKASAFFRNIADSEDILCVC